MKRMAFATILIVAIYVAGVDLDLPARSHAQTNLRPFELFWNGRHIDKSLLEDKEELTKLVLQIAEKEEGDPGEILLQLKAARTNGEPLPVPMRGLSGMFIQPLVEVLTCIIVDDEPARVKIHGDITGYHFNEDINSGFLKVETVSYFSENCLSAGVANFKHHEWYIYVDGIYQVVPRVFDPVDPFPNTMDLPEVILDEITSATGELAHMTHKLFAQGEGIEVLLINENGLPLPPTDALYMTDADSCIDIFFDSYPPETGVPEKPHYCLGRCETPAIVGTM